MSGVKLFRCLLLFVFLAAALAVPHRGETGADGRGGEGILPAAVAPVDRDSIETAIRWLTVDPATQMLQTRFVLREEPLGAIADSLAARLARYTGAPAQRLAFSFQKIYYANDSTYTAENVVGRVAGTGAVPGAFLVTAHYDAIASRTTGWNENWKTWAAPGADDNATGVAAVLEAARAIGERAQPLPFDVLFVLFSAEEFDRIGSVDFLSRLSETYEERIIGVLNFDMLGFSGSGVRRGTAVLTNPISGWLSDCVASYHAMIESGLSLDVVSLGRIVSDHQSFWEAGIAAVTLMEPLDGDRVAYPYYHTVLDTLGRIDVEQTARITDLATGFLDDLAARPAEIALLDSDVLLRRRGRVTSRTLFAVGDTVEIWVRARNIGAAYPPAGATVEIRVLLETAKGARLIGETTVPAPAALEMNDFVVPVILGAAHAGENVVRASIAVSGMGDDRTNNEAGARFAVEGPSGPVLMHSIQPNPVRGALRAASFCMNLSRPVDAHLELLTMEGERIGAAYMGERWGSPLEAGLTCTALGSLFPDLGEVASGIFLYRLIVYEGASQTKLVGRFAVAR